MLVVYLTLASVEITNIFVSHQLLQILEMFKVLLQKLGNY